MNGRWNDPGRDVAELSERVNIENLIVCVGAQKAGTTWLARALARHPDIFVTPVKEIHYFDHVRGITNHLNDRKRRSRHRKYHQKLWTQPHRFSANRALGPWYRDYMASPIDDAWYGRLFAVRTGRRFAMEATPEYALIGREGFGHLKGLAPGVKALFIMRNPVARAWSQVLHHCRSVGHDVAGLSDPDLIALVDSERFEALGDYRRTIEDLTAVLAHDRFALAFYEDIHRDRPAALARICDFIGAGFDAGWFQASERPVNVSQPGRMPDRVRAHLVAKYRDQAAWIDASHGPLPASWQQTFGP